MQTYMLGLLLLLLPLTGITGEDRVPLVAKTVDGETRVYAHQYTNHWGRREVRLVARTIPKFGSANPILGYGRDTDDDDVIDTWFMIDADKGLVRHDLPARHPWGHDVIRTQLFKRYESSAKAHFSAAYGAVFGFVLMSVGSAYESERQLWRELIDLEEFGLRHERGRKSADITREQWMESVDLISTGYIEAIARFEKATGGQFWGLVAADAGLWVTGGVVVKGLMKAASFIGKPFTQSTLGKKSQEFVEKFVRGIKDRAHAQITYFTRAKGAPVNALAAATFQRRFPGHMRSLMAKNILNRKLIPLAVRSGLAVRRAATEWKYIGLMTGLQLSTEAWANSAEVYDANPTVFAKNVLTHPDIIQNVGYMTTNAYLMTAASLAIKPKGLRYATCAFIALGNSTITNLVIKGETDYARIALDSSWEAVIGNAQIQIDLAALKYFEEQALKKKNPRLKLLGWAVVLVDQTAGFLGYSHATRSLNDVEKTETKLVPVIVED